MIEIDYIDEELWIGTPECAVCRRLYDDLMRCIDDGFPDPVWMETSRRLDAHHVYCDKIRAERRRRRWRARVDWFRKLLSRLTGGFRR